MSVTERFQDNPSGAITDTQHQKQWLPKDSWQDLGKWSTFKDARAYVLLMNQVYAGGFSDWRLPTLEDVEQLYDPERIQKDWEGKEVHIHNLFVTKCAAFLWTSDENDQGQARRVNLRDGSSEFVDKTEQEHMATRLVRDIKN